MKNLNKAIFCLLSIFITISLTGCMDVNKNDTLTLNKKEVHLSSKKLKVGDSFKMNYSLDLPAETIDKQKTEDLSKIKGWKVIETVPSLDTPVCSMQTAELNLLAPKYKNVTFIIVSQDLPFAQARYCGSKAVNNVKVFSDYKDKDFSIYNGLLVEENSLNARAIVVLDDNNKVKYVEYADEITEPLHLQKALNVIK